LRIAIIIETFPSLSETFLSNKVKQLCLRGHKVYVFCNKVNGVLFNELFRNDGNISVISLYKRNIIPYLLGHPRSIVKSLKSGGNFRQNIFRNFRVSHINRVSPDIIHFGFSGVALSYLSDIDKLKGKKVVSCRGTAENVNLLVNKQRQVNLRKLFDKVDAIHCVSEALKRTVYSYCRQPNKFFVNNPAIDTEIFKRNVAYTTHSPFIILSVGRFIFQKGYLVGLLAIKKLKEYNSNFKWIIAGDGPQHDEMIFYIHQMNLKHHVVLVGNKNREEVIDLYKKACVFFLPSVTEGIANVVLEAMSMELPVVSSKCGGMEEVITHGENGLLSDVYDPESFAENLAELFENTELRIALGKAGRKKVSENFDLPKQIDKFESIYNQLLNNYPVNNKNTFHKDCEADKIISHTRYRKEEKKLRIGVIVPQFPSYTETFFINQITGICERGHTVIVFCNVYIQDAQLKEAYHLQNYSNLKIVALDFNKLSDAFFTTIFANPFVLIRNLNFSKKKFLNNLYYDLCKLYFKKSKCDIYHFGYSGLAVSYLPVLRSLPGKIFVSCLGTAENIKPLTEQGRIEKLNILFNTVDKIHCVSEKMSKTVKEYGATCEKIFVNRPAIDINTFSRRKEYAEHKKINILSIGRLVFQKGFLMGILAIAELIKKFKNFQWTIIGDGPEKEQLLFHINALGLNDHVHLTGKKLRDEVIQFYEESDILLLPSVSEGIANVILEAMAMEVPVVSTISGGAEEVISTNVNGILVPNYDYQLMACELYSLCIDFKRRKQIGQEGRKTVESDFALERYIDVFEEEYLKLVEK